LKATSANDRIWPRPRRTLALACAAALAACATGQWSPRNVHPGDPRDQVLRLMGPPTASYRMSDGHERLEYNHMPAGRQTFMVDLDEAGRVRRWENVLDENHFAGIVPGMERADVLRLIGPPSFTGRYWRPTPGITWLYRWQSPLRCVVFEVSFDVATGRVLEGDYLSDPGCPDEYR